LNISFFLTEKLYNSKVNEIKTREGEKDLNFFSLFKATLRFGYIQRRLFHKKEKEKGKKT